MPAPYCPGRGPNTRAARWRYGFSSPSQSCFDSASEAASNNCARPVNTSRNKPGDPQRHVDAGPAEQRRRNDLKSGDAAGGLVPARRDAGEMQGHREFLARRSHRRRAPEIDDQSFRPVAVILQMPAQQFLGELDALAHARRASAPRADRPQTDCARSAARRSVRDSGEPAGPGATRLAGQRVDQRAPLLLAARAATENMQAVAELALLQVADEAVDPRNRFGWCGGRRQGRDRLPRRRRALRRGSRQSRRWRRAGSRPSAVEYSSSNCSSRTRFCGNALAASGGGRWPMVTAPMRRLACAASPGSLTMKG